MIEVVWLLLTLDAPKIVDRQYIQICENASVDFYLGCKGRFDQRDKIQYYMDYCTEVNSNLYIKKLNVEDECYKQTLENRRSL